MSTLHNLARTNNHGKLELILKNLDHKDVVNKKDEFSRTPLHLASYEGHFECVDVLLRYGADINSLARNAMTSLHFAVQAGRLEIVKLLCKKGANINSRTNNCMTPLHLALSRGHAECAAYLIEKGARQRYNKKEELPLDLASPDVKEQLKERLGDLYSRFESEIIGKKVKNKETVQFYKKRKT